MPATSENFYPDTTNLDKFTTDCLPEFESAIAKGSLGFLSVVKNDLLCEIAAHPDAVFQDFAKDAEEYYTRYPNLKEVKDAFFGYTLAGIQHGGENLIPQLAKGVTNKEQLEIYLGLISEGQSLASRETELLIYPGSFDPMHYGHRIMITSLLGSVGTDANLAVNVNSYQERKRYLEETYERRLADIEYKLLKSQIINPYTACVMDFRFGVPEGEDHLRQTRMQSFMAGDAQSRWVIGGDKFLSEVERARKEEAGSIIGRSLSRFCLSDMSIYVVPRKGQDPTEFRDLTTEHNEKYSAEFIFVEEKEYEGQPISSSLIRAYRDRGDLQSLDQANQMENADLTRDYRS